MRVYILFFIFLIPDLSHANKSADPVRVYFNHNQASSYMEPYRGIQRVGDNFEAIFQAAILEANTSIELAVQELRLPILAKALALASKKGVKVSVVLENKYSRPLSELTPAQVAALPPFERARYDEFVRLVDVNGDGVLSPAEIADRDALIILRNAGVKWIDDTADGSKGSGLMHHKFMVIDKKTTLVSSANLTTSDIHGDFIAPNTRGNANALVVFRDAAVSSVFSQEFNTLWTAHFGLKKTYLGARKIQVGTVPVTVQFSPTSKKHGFEASTNGLISREVLKAKHTAHLALFVFSEQKIADSLNVLNEGGGVVRTLIDRLFATRYYSELMDMLGLAMLNPKCVYEKENNPWKKPIVTGGVPGLPAGDTLHHKFAVLDGQRVLFGSHNWSAAGNNLNDETFLVIENEKIARLFEEEFNRLYNNSVLGVQPWMLQKIKDMEKSCQ